ncbi:HNH endonuclease [bacterium]|nr:HNH endonuclease [bacterium]
MYSNILNIGEPTALNDAKCQEKLDIDYQERWLVKINAYKEEISKIRSLLQEPFWIESNEKPIICPFDGYSSYWDLLRSGNSNKYLYKDCLYYADGLYTDEEKKLLIMENFDQERRKFERLKNKHEYSDDTKYQRPNIPESVRIIVWKRDSGKCVNCGSRENLEYDHIIPISKGGSNTARNIELLCENCNRSKGAKIE